MHLELSTSTACITATLSPDEALSLAKTLCDDDSPAFIHGLLSAVSADAEATEVAEQPTEPSAE